MSCQMQARALSRLDTRWRVKMHVCGQGSESAQVWRGDNVRCFA
jgi:hypothetical protein